LERTLQVRAVGESPGWEVAHGMQHLRQLTAESRGGVNEQRIELNVKALQRTANARRPAADHDDIMNVVGCH
jgi:hypothetical protein